MEQIPWGQLGFGGAALVALIVIVREVLNFAKPKDGTEAIWKAIKGVEDKLVKSDARINERLAANAVKIETVWDIVVVDGLRDARKEGTVRTNSPDVVTDRWGHRLTHEECTEMEAFVHERVKALGEPLDVAVEAWRKFSDKQLSKLEGTGLSRRAIFATLVVMAEEALR